MLIDAQPRRLTVITAGKAALDTLQALRDLGLDEARCRALGISLVKLGMVWPLRCGIHAQCLCRQPHCAGGRGKAVIEEQLAGALYALPGERPVKDAGVSRYRGRRDELMGRFQGEKEAVLF